MNNKDNFWKRTEYYLKGKFDRFLFNSVESVYADKPVFRLSVSKGARILIIRSDRIGDILVTTPFLSSLKKQNPNVIIDVVLSTKNIAAKRAFEPYINSFFVYRKNLLVDFKMLLELRARNYDIVIDTYDNPSSTNAMFIKIINPLYSLGIQKSKTNRYSIEVPLLNKNKYHIVERINQLALPFGMEPSNIKKNIEFLLKDDEIKTAWNFTGGKKKKYRLGINLAGSSMSKFWGFDNYLNLINHISSNYPNFEILLLNNAETNEIKDRLIENTSSFGIPSTQDFNIFAAIVNTCDIILTPDTSVVHLAAAFKIPCIGLFLFSGTKETGIPWTPYNSPHKCLKTKTGVLSNIDVEEVAASFAELITEHNLN